MALIPGPGPGGRATVTAARTRCAAAITAVVVVGLGLALRAVSSGSIAKYGGDALYTLLLLVLVVLVAPRIAPLKAAGSALAVSCVIELCQLSSVPAELSGRSVVARLVLGSTFNPPDFFWYLVGAGVGWFLHAQTRQRGERRGP
jgi:hypothetical protein